MRRGLVNATSLLDDEIETVLQKRRTYHEMTGSLSAKPPMHICAAEDLLQVASGLGDYRLLSLMSPSHPDETWRLYARHTALHLAFNDIIECREGLVAPDRAMVERMIAFGSDDSALPLLIHCWAGISRSSAAAYIIACAHSVGHEPALAVELRRRAPFATPNRLMVSLADDLLSRGGRMIDAIAAIGRGEEANVGTPYTLPLIWSD